MELVLQKVSDNLDNFDDDYFIKFPSSKSSK